MSTSPLRVLFLNENTLGHTSYLPAFVREFQRSPELGIIPETADVAPLPEERMRLTADPFRGAHRVGLSTHYRKWREQASLHAKSLLQERWASGSPKPDIVVANTQSVALELPSLLSSSIPFFVCLDATFRQLSRTPWFAPDLPSRLFQRWTISDLLERERRIFAQSNKVLCWSQSVAESLRSEYSIPAESLRLLPPSIPDLPEDQGSAGPRGAAPLPRILFVGGDFRRKGGPELLACYRKYFSQSARLDIVTASEVNPEPGVSVWKNLRAWSPEWIALWRSADLFVFPSHLETFGIVLLEAQAFRVPIVASAAGAAREILDNGEAGWLLDRVDVSSLRLALERALSDPGERERRAARGHASFQRKYSLGNNTRQLASWLHQEAYSR